LLRLNGQDLRSWPIEERKAKLAALLKNPPQREDKSASEVIREKVTNEASFCQYNQVGANILPIDKPTEVTGLISLKNKVYLSLDSSDKVLEDGVRHPIKDMAIWFDANGNKIPPVLQKAANTGKPVTLHGFFKWPHDHSELIFRLIEG
jgi:hypothetical protein